MMRKPLRLRRYLVHFSSHNIPQVFTDVLVLGSGVAGLSAALALPGEASVLVVSKGELGGGSTAEAQGGIAAATGPEDDPEQHFRDTLEAGCGLCDEEAARVVTGEAPQRIEELVERGVEFDRCDDGFSRTREGGHSRA
ncbi:MAG: FAD-dependent oxidoreductase, partial [Candidatus Brocadiaceae bacterium]